jgi:2',3'-cyclic-nucleotide 2'-phosphodiesterase (5'-nucleotidase family)
MNIRRFISVFALLALLSGAASAQLRYSWSTVKMDSRFDNGSDRTATAIIEKYNPLVAPLQEIIGYSDREYAKSAPESGLSNFAADIIRETAEKACGKRVDLALTNFGGIRTSLPKGAIRVYDIFSIFPFENRIVVFDIKGRDLLKFFQQMARRCEALSGVYFVAHNGEIVTLRIGDRPFDVEKTYRMATIDFLMTGGDGVSLEKCAMHRLDTGILIRDAIVDHIKQMTAEGKTVRLFKEGRVSITK